MKPSDAAGAEPAIDSLAALTQALDTLDTGAYIADDRGCIVAVNTKALVMLAWTRAQLIGQDAHDLLHRTPRGERIPRARCPIRRAVHAGSTEQGSDEWMERSDGSLLPVSWLVTPCEIGTAPTATLVLFHPRLPVQSPVPGAEPDGLGLTELERLELLAETTTVLTSTLDVEEALHRLVALVIPRLADWAVIDLLVEGGGVRRFTVAHAAEGGLSYREDLQGPMPPVPQESSMPLSRALRGVASAIAGPETYQGPPDSDIAVEQRRLFASTGMHCAAIAPISSLRAVLGAVTLGRADDPRSFDPTDVALLEDIARRAGLALDNARLYQRQRKVAETMQRHLLPQLPRLTGLSMTARYLLAPDASQVGGDWYDAFALSDESTAVAIGDVVGHDLDAAAGMAQLRSMLRAYAWAQREPPSRILQWLDRAAVHVAEASMATVVLGRVTVADGGECALCWSNAGHPPPLLVTREGDTRYLTDAHGVMLGVAAELARPDATETLPPGSTLVFYTDGLIEAPDQSLDEGFACLSRQAAPLAREPLDEFSDQLLVRARPLHNDDDVAILALRIPEPTGAD